MVTNKKISKIDPRTDTKLKKEDYFRSDVFTLRFKILPVNGSTDVHISGSAVDHKVVVMLAPGPDGVLDVVEGGIVPVLGPNSEEWGSRQVHIFHDFHCVR